MFDAGKFGGARIHSGSWGTTMETASYTSFAKLADEELYANENFMAFFAAGNSGRFDRPSSVISPALAKNVVASKYQLTFFILLMISYNFYS